MFAGLDSTKHIRRPSVLRLCAEPILHSLTAGDMPKWAWNKLVPSATKKLLYEDAMYATI